MATTKKCDLCGQLKEGVLQPSGTFLCPPCEKKVLARIEAAKKPSTTETIALDRMELWKLKADGLLSVKGYVYLALRLDYPEQAQDVEDEIYAEVDIEDFCSRWRLSQHDLLTALGALGRKGRVFVSTQRIGVKTLTRDQAMALLEKAANKK